MANNNNNGYQRNNQRNDRRNNGQNDEFHFYITEHIGVLGTGKNGWNKEVNVVEWNDKPPKVDIRDWDPDHERMSRGITLTEEEAENMTKILCMRYGIGNVFGEKAENTDPGTFPVEEAPGPISGMAADNQPSHSGLAYA